MKKTLIVSVMLSFIVSLISGVAIATAAGINPLPVAGGIFSMSFIKMPTASGIVAATVYKEVWTGKVKEQLSTSEKATFLEGVEDFSQYVSAAGDEAQVIHLVYMGVEPTVLINNTTYPIPVTELGQEDIVISLDKYQTEATPITDDELYALSYDKIQTVKNKHAKAILKNKIKKSIHALAPSGNTATMPVIVTTGADDGTGRKRLMWADLVTLKDQLDKLEVPDEGRRLVLCTDHANDLLLIDQKYRDYLFNPQSGMPQLMLCGFEIYSYVANPYYTVSTKAKLSFGAVPQTTDRRASIFFSMARAAKATGWTKMYYSESKTDPQNQRNLVNFRHYFVVLPTREDGRGAIISATV